jgi:hypothetical protein
MLADAAAILLDAHAMWTEGNKTGVFFILVLVENIFFINRSLKKTFFISGPSKGHYP